MKKYNLLKRFLIDCQMTLKKLQINPMKKHDYSNIRLKSDKKNDYFLDDDQLQRRNNMIANPLNDGIFHVYSEILNLEWTSYKCIPSFIIAIVLSITLLLLVILWPYGLFAIVEDMLRKMMIDTIDNIKGVQIAVAMGYTISLGFLFIIWLPFFIICLPFYVLGGISKYIFTNLNKE